jgi:hypothetical protein
MITMDLCREVGRPVSLWEIHVAIARSDPHLAAVVASKSINYVHLVISNTSSRQLKKYRVAEVPGETETGVLRECFWGVGGEAYDSCWMPIMRREKALDSMMVGIGPEGCVGEGCVRAEGEVGGQPPISFPMPAAAAPAAVAAAAAPVETVNDRLGREWVRWGWQSEARKACVVARQWEEWEE